MKAIIFAAGLGTRLKPLTDTMPKALVPVGGKPLLEHLILKMKRVGVDEIVVNVHHFGQQIIDFLQENRNFGIRISVSDERGLLLETGGGIKKAAVFLSGNEPFLVHNVDILSNLDLARFYARHTQDDLATLLVSERPTSRYLLFDGENRLVGWTNVLTGEVKSPFPDLDVPHCRKYAFSGIHVVSPTIFPLMEGWQGKFSIIDFYLSVAATSSIKAYVDNGLKILDVGKVDSLRDADRFLDLR